MSESQEPLDPYAPKLPLDAPAELPPPPLPRPPFWMVSIALISVVVTWLPLAIIARARTIRGSEPRISLAQDMGKQPRFNTQETNALFADDRAMRPQVPGTVSQRDLEDDSVYYHGFTVKSLGRGATTQEVTTSFPNQTPITMALLQRGQNRFNIYCFPCHGLDGSGTGPVNQRSIELMQNGAKGMSWTTAAILTSEPIRIQPDGKIFNTITNGIRKMPSYEGQITVADRWAIVAYVRALQLSQNAPLSVVPPEKQDAMQAQSAPAAPTSSPSGSLPR
jgi:mono/diheme cytochrome c family protein